MQKTSRILYYTMNDEGKMSYERDGLIDKLMKGKLKFEDLLNGSGSNSNTKLKSPVKLMKCY